MGKLIHLVADYAAGDLAVSEILSALHGALPDGWSVHPTNVGSFDTLGLGFVLAQLGLQDDGLRPKEMIIYANCAPREDRSEARQNNEGEGLIYCVLNSGVACLVVNSGYSLSFAKGAIRELWSTTIPKSGSQFRSRDVFPPYVTKVASGDVDFLKEQLPTTLIPEPPYGVVGYVDSFGNLKTTYRVGDTKLAGLNSGDRIRLQINGVTRTATVATGSFNVREGDLAFAPGSSGHGRRFWEIFQRSGNAWKTFLKPSAGAPINMAEVFSV